jgi:HAD superfamily hydrolase (TIGR01549 family)
MAVIYLPNILINGEELRFEFALFDVDGTLVDDEDRYRNLAALRFSAIETRAGKRAAETWAPLGGYDPAKQSLDMFGPIAKASRREDMAIAAVGIYSTGRDWHDARAIAEAAYADADATQLKNYTPRLFPGVSDSLHRLKELGFTLGIATNGPSQITKDLFKMLGIYSLFSVVIGSEDAMNPKPAPDLLITACEMANISPSNTVYIGDQFVDAEAAKAAGCICSIIVGRSLVVSSPAIHRVTSVADLHVHP